MPATERRASAGTRAAREELKAARPTGSESTPEPTMDLTRLAVEEGSEAWPSSVADAARMAVERRPSARRVDIAGLATCRALAPCRARRAREQLRSMACRSTSLLGKKNSHTDWHELAPQKAQQEFADRHPLLSSPALGVRLLTALQVLQVPRVNETSPHSRLEVPRQARPEAWPRRPRR